MEKTTNVEDVISSFKNVDTAGGIRLENARKISEDLKSMLTSVNRISLLKQRKNFEVVFPLFMRTVFHPDPDVSQPLLELCDVVLTVLESRLPKLKKEKWWNEFETKVLIELLDSLESRIEANDDSWVALFTLASRVIITESLKVTSLNRLLAISQLAFVKGKNDERIRDKAWLSWKRIMDALSRSPKSLMPHKAVQLLMRPLKAVSHQSECQISTWVHLIELKEISGPSEFVKVIVEAMCKTFYRSDSKSASRQFPASCAEALIKILSHDHVVQNCLSDIIEIFGACVSSKPPTGLIDQLAGVLVKSINNMSDAGDGTSYRLWKRLFEQYNSCSESQILSSACQKIFTDINFLRLIESNSIEGKEIAVLMDSREFREKVLLRSVLALTFNDEPGTPTVKNTRKSSYEDVWSKYCDAYLSWWSNQSPPSSPKDRENPEATNDSFDHQATQFLLLQPLQLNIWNPSISKTWSLLCETCHKHKLLHECIKSIFDAVDGPNFHVQKAIDVADCLFKLDNDFCKHSAKLLETFATAIWSMEFQNLLDVLNLSETAVLYPELSSVLGKICKGANEKSADYDQLNGHKIKTKVSKVIRKLEQLVNSAEKEKPNKAQRTPFRAQSNFLQRLAKAEEKSRTKSPFLASLYSSTEKMKVENGADTQNNGADVMDSLENGVITADDEKSVNLDNSDMVPVITLPSMLKGASPLGTGDADGMVAEKENVIMPAINGSNASPTTVGSPKIKIMNAREVKPVDASSPVVSKKPKPVAGQKSTPKKITPSKVSYFDDDANDCIMVPPKPKTTPLTEHQMEMMAKRRTDIPALYQDLSQDTQSQQVPVVEEVTTGVSPRTVQGSQDIVPRTPSPEDCVPVSAPELRKSAGKTCPSAKKLDFNNLPTPPSDKSSMIGSVQELSPLPEDKQSEEKKLACGLPLAQSGAPDSLVNGIGVLTNDSKEGEEVIEEPKAAVDEKSKRKRKSEPSKFSPKLTRSKKNLKSATPDAKLTRLPEPDSKGKEEPCETGMPSTSQPPDASVQTVASLMNTCVDTKLAVQSDTPSPDKIEVSSHVAENKLPSSQKKADVHPPSQDQPTKGRKRKVVDSSDEETPKKGKTSTEDNFSAGKKSDSTKKKKRKPFKLGVGGNLENWLVKTERVSTLVTEQEANGEKIGDPDDEAASESKQVGSGKLPNDAAGELDNSDEIVPSTQDGLLLEKQNPVWPMVEVKDEVKCGNEELVEQKKECPTVAIPNDGDNQTPEKSVPERLSHESPHDDDIASVISPSVRQRRAPSVFRGEGDTCISKEKLNSTPDPEEVSKASRAKNKVASPTCKRRLQPLGGRSAKMLRLAASTSSQGDNDDIVVTPVRRRESIAPVKYGENWPKGPVEDWVACTPASPYMSPFRSALKKTPGLEEISTPQRVKNDSLASPLLSSARRKRVMFLDPPVTRGLAYDTDSPGGSVHHADVPQGSPYPTWKGDDVRMEISPSKRDAERLNSLADHKTNNEPPGGIQEETSPSKLGKGTPKTQLDLIQFTTADISNEVQQLIGPTEPTNTVPGNETNIKVFQEKFKLTDDFMTAFAEIDSDLQFLLIQCFDCTNMADTVDAWKFGDCRRICQMPRSFLLSVQNLSGEILTDILASGVFSAPSNKRTESSAQTEQLLLSDNSSQTRSPLFADFNSQTVATKTSSVGTNTHVATSSSSTQADMVLPAADEWPSLFRNATTQEALLYLSDSLRALSSSLPTNKMRND